MISPNTKRSLFWAKKGETFVAEETPVQTVPAEDPSVPEAAKVIAAAAAVPAVEALAAPAASNTPRKGSSLLVFLTVLLILVGIVDVILWGVAGYYLLRGPGNGAGGASAQPTAMVAAPADS